MSGIQINYTIIIYVHNLIHTNHDLYYIEMFCFCSVLQTAHAAVAATRRVHYITIVPTRRFSSRSAIVVYLYL